MRPAQPGRRAAAELPRGDAKPALEPFGPLPTRLNYFRGSDPSRWRADVPVWSGVRYRGLYPDLDLVIDGAAGHFAWRWEPTGQQGWPRWRAPGCGLEGADGLALTAGGLALTTALGERTLALPALAGAGPGGDGGPRAGRR